MCLIKHAHNPHTHVQYKAYVVTATCYQPVPEQTNSNPGITADMSVIDLNDPLALRWCAISRDLFAEIGFGAVIEVSGTGIYDGIWTVRDLMNKRHVYKVDFLVGLSDPLGKWSNVLIRIISHGEVKT